MQMLKYLETAGGTKQYIDTGYLYKGSSRLKAKFICYSNGYTAYQAAYGSYGTNAWWTFYSRTNNTSDFGVNLGTAWNTTSDSILDEDIVIESNIATGLTTWESETLEYSLQQASGASTHGIENFCLFTSGNSYAIQQNEFGKYRFYYMEMYEGDTLVHKWVPVLDNNNVVCIYDTVTEEYLYNKGTVAFTAGPVWHPYYMDGTVIFTQNSYEVGGGDRLYYTATTPTGTSITLAVKVGSGSYTTVASGGLVPGLPESGTVSLSIKATLTTADEESTPTLSAIWIYNDICKKVVVLGLNVPEINPAVGNVSVTYDGNGGLAGIGGPASAFSEDFTPGGLTWKGNQNDEEHVTFGISSDVTLRKVLYYNAKSSDEHIEFIGTSAGVTVTHVQDL